MILQSLKVYYDRLAADEKSDIPRFGFSREKISWAIVINREGNLVPPVLDLRQTDEESKNRKPQAVSRIVPQRVIVSGKKILANFLWGDTGYVFGADSKGDSERSRGKFAAFRKRLYDIGGDLDDEGMSAVLRFTDKWNPDNAPLLDYWDEIIDTNIVFRLDGDEGFVHERPAVYNAYLQSRNQENGQKTDFCLITGEQTSISRLHPGIQGVRNANSTGARFVSFNLDAFCSYGKEQGANAPVGEYAAFAYTTALNWLLHHNSRQKIQIGDATTVFWAEKPVWMEDSFYYLFNPPAEKQEKGTVEDTAKVNEIRVFLDAVRQGKYRELGEDMDTKFYILGLSPNAARISVRFWHVSTTGDIVEQVGKHFRDIGIEKQFTTEMEYPGIRQLLRETSVQGKTENIPPLLAGTLMRSILSGEKYPESLLATVIGRIRSDHIVSYRKTLLIKGCLVRNHYREVSMSLDRGKNDPAYLLGRLFAALERSQEDASGGHLNSTIKDRYFSSASATPRAVFPILLRLNQHHVAKGKHGGYYTRLIGEIMERLPADKLPTHMPMADQGLFAIGYYHQRNDFFRKHDTTETEA